MGLLYNIDFEVAATVLLIILNIYTRLQYSSEPARNRQFQNLAAIMLVTVILDVVTAVTISYATAIPVWVNMTLNFAYLTADAVLEYQFFVYSLYCVHKYDPQSTFVRVHRTFTVLCIAVLTVNFPTGGVFSFTAAGEYVKGPLYYFVFAVPLYYIIITSGVFFSGFHLMNKNQKLSIIFYSAVTIAGPIVQLMFPNVLMVLFTVSLGFMMLLFSLETGDYRALMQTMDELARTKDEAEEAMRQAQEANRAKSDFLSNMSHELRTPLNSVLGFNEMIMQNSDDKKIREYSDNVRSSGKTLLSIISSILDYVEIDDGKLKIENAAYSSESMLRDVISFARYCTERRQLDLKLDIDENMPCMISGDMTRVTQIFNNIISNAAKYTDKGYVKIHVSWKSDGEQTGTMSVRITDTGIGMLPEDIERISECFVRFDRGRTDSVEGIGMGLSIVTRLLGLMGSRPYIESEYGRGTAVSFEIKQGIVNPAPIGKAPTESEDSGGDSRSYLFRAPKARILTVDDSSMNLRLFAEFLRESEAVIDTAPDGREALKLIENKSYDIIFLDHMMPVMDGMETIRAIKEKNLCPDVPVIVLTANTVAGDRDEYFSAGFDDYLAKPATKEQLYSMVRRHISPGLVEPMPEAPEAPEISADGNKTEEAAVQTTAAATAATAPAGKTVMEKLSEFLDTKSALEYCCDDEEFYMSVLETYTDSSRLTDMENFYKAEDWDNYRITVHSIKSTSLTIGAAELSEKAKGLEMAQKEGRIEYIHENHAAVYEEYKQTLRRIEGIINGTDSPAETVQETASLPKVLVVDDDRSCLRIAEKSLSADFSVKTAGSGTEALDILETYVPDLILLDVYMPEMDGFDLYSTIREEESDIPIAFLTSDPDKMLEERCLEEGAMDFITKPVTGKILVNRLNRIIELDRLRSIHK